MENLKFVFSLWIVFIEEMAGKLIGRKFVVSDKRLAIRLVENLDAQLLLVFFFFLMYNYY